MTGLAEKLSELSLSSASRASWRQAALALLGSQVRFDAALFHELSPRVSLHHAGLVAIEPKTLEATRGDWDQNAVEFGRLQIRALAQGGVATDREAFASNRRARDAWKRRVTEPLGLRSVLAAHLVVDEKIISVVMLGRRTGLGFTSAERKALAPLVPVLTVCDALQIARARLPLGGASTRVRCVDQRLTLRQREVVEHVALGRTNLEIGSVLGISHHTVRNLLVEVRRKLGAANRAEVVHLSVLG